MEYFWWLYLATRLDSIAGAFQAAIISSIIFIVVGAFVAGIASADLYRDVDARKQKIWATYRWWRNVAIVLLTISSIGAVFTPTKKDAMFIAGGVGVIEAAKAIQGSEIAKKSVQIIEQWLANELEDLKKENTKNSKKTN